MRFGTVLACLLVLAGAVAATASSRELPRHAPSAWRQANGSEPLSFQSGFDDIPPCEGASVSLRPIWMAAAREFDVRWQILAAISKIESGFGCNMGPSSAGAVGWTQFMPATWRAWGVDADGDGEADPHNAVDAVYATARYLRVSGAPGDYRKAIFAYNRADWYVRDVLETAETFGSFSSEEFDQIATFSAEGQALQRRIADTEAGVKRSARVERRRLRSVRAGQSQYQLVRRAARLAQQRFADSRDRLNRATSQYIGLADGLVKSDDMPQGGDQNVLAYAADAKAQDAVLVYQSAGALMDVQGIALDRLRAAAVNNNQARAQAQTLLLRAEDANRVRVENLLEAQTARVKRERGLRQLRRDRATYQQTLRIWARRYGAQLGDRNLLDNPFIGSMGQSDRAQRMLMVARAELAWGVKEEPDGSNDSPDIARYRDAVPDSGVGPWCAYFISYLAMKAGQPLADGHGFARVDDMVAYAKGRDEWIEDVSQARSGDIIFFPQHVGMVERVVDGDITTIEGNSSNAVRRRHGRQVGAVGLWRLSESDAPQTDDNSGRKSDRSAQNRR